MEDKIQVCFREKWYHIYGRVGYLYLSHAEVSNWITTSYEKLQSFLRYRDHYEYTHRLEIFVIDGENMYSYELHGVKNPNKTIRFAVPSWCK